MAREDEGTIIVSNGGANESNHNASASSPLSSLPDHENEDAPTMPDQLPDTPSTSLAQQRKTPTNTSKMARGKRRLLVKKAPRKSKWNADNILTDQKSPLASADLRSILSNPMAWDILGKEEKAEILALFPDSQHVLRAGTEQACPDFASLMNDDSFRHDCAAYTENIAQGRHDPEWLAQAWAAHERRKMGDFDEFLDSRFKDEWEVELPPELKTKRGPPMSKEASDVRMEDTESAKKKDVDIENGIKGKKEDPDIDEEVDELQRCDPTEKEPIVMAIGHRKSSAMEIDGEDTKDELA
ncbi:hypothetical protein F53441_3583 [Fusarium austroafricanum]|uniref:DEUBAD domain-containing protein n=1 Tax=Fusarium austroafricanum TaxID=2364996 RepID=A0A8H4KM53_9HYPO|nr:hypothetical protein F53441_3583 [Fusarium austroafricanum]